MHSLEARRGWQGLPHTRQSAVRRRGVSQLPVLPGTAPRRALSAPATGGFTEKRQNRCDAAGISQVATEREALRILGLSLVKITSVSRQVAQNPSVLAMP